MKDIGLLYELTNTNQNKEMDKPILSFFRTKSPGRICLGTAPATENESESDTIKMLLETKVKVKLNMINERESKRIQDHATSMV